MQLTVFQTPVIKDILRCVAFLYVKIIGWKCIGEKPDVPKCIIVGAPHTSNWDLPIMLAIALLLKLDVYWMGKDAIFRPPFRGLFKWLGGIPIDRSQSNSTVPQTIELFNHTENLSILIPPEGTRKKTQRWKTGFYHIAVGANIPIVMGFVDYEKKRSGLGITYYPTGEIDTDLPEIQQYYEQFTPKYPDKFSAEIESDVRNPD